MKDVWRNVNTNMSDFKELTPEFYDPLQEGKFCTNLFGINFGHRHDGTKVNDVELPPWANGCKLLFPVLSENNLYTIYFSCERIRFQNA